MPQPVNLNRNINYSLAEGGLFTDQYQLSMAQLYYHRGLHERLVQFDHFFRSYPDYGSHNAGYCINAGLEWFIDWLADASLSDEDIDCLRAQTGRDNVPVFKDDFLRWLQEASQSLTERMTMQAIPEGRVVHPNVPLMVVQGPLALAQLVETSLLNHLNYQILIATKAARIRESSQGQLLLEFGLRRGHGKGANAGARAALIGGADFSSNVGASHLMGLSPKGTHAHSMVQVFMALGMGELGAFQAYAEAYPDDCLLLVDTIDTLNSGMPNAIKVFEQLRRQGHQPVGVRLDSGDLAYLSIQVAKMLNDAGFEDASIVLSNELDELTILQILTQINQEAPRYGVEPAKLRQRLVYGVGTRLITSKGDPALNGVYKLVAVQEDDSWTPALKISESPNKTPNPGHKNVWRVYDKRGVATADLLSLDNESPAEAEQLLLRHPSDHTKYRYLEPAQWGRIEPLLCDIIRDGRLVYQFPPLEEIRAQRQADLERLDAGVKRIMNPHIYHVSLTEALWNMKYELIASVKKQNNVE